MIAKAEVASKEQAAGPGDWDEVVDVLVIGAGAGGMTAALVSALLGAKTMLCEKSDAVGGTTAWSGGSIWIPASDQALAAGFDDSKSEGLAYLAAESPYESAADLRAAYIETGPMAVSYLESHSQVRFYPVPDHPDYLVHTGAKSGGRPLAPVPFDGRRLGKDISILRRPLPVWTVLGGMMVAREDLPHLLNMKSSLRSLAYSIGLVTRYLRDRLIHHRSMRLVLGNALAGRLLYSSRMAGVDIQVNAPLLELLRDESGVIGGRIERAGKSYRVRAEKAVILAAGGFAHSKKWREKLMEPKYAAGRTAAFPGNTGDSLELATAIGASVEQEHMAPGFQIPLSFMRENGEEQIWLHSWDRSKPGLIIVDRSGKRFANEAQSYHLFVEQMQRNNNSGNNASAFVVCDREHLRKYGFGLIRPGTKNVSRYIKSGYLLEGSSIEELAEAALINADALKQTIATFNKYARQGVDEDFQRGTTPLDKVNGDPKYGPNPSLGEIRNGPFYAIQIWPGDIGTSIGLRGDINGQVLDAAGKPIPGLYACGNDLSSVMRGHYPGPGITLGPAIVFAYRAAMSAMGTDPFAASQADRRT